MKNPIQIFLIFVFSFISLVGQSRLEENLKRTAIQHMQAGRYGEAIDLLNKYIAANAQEAEGYNLRGLCYEKRSQYYYAILEFRRARKLDPDNAEIQENLARVWEIWRQILYNRIEGFHREIEIDPDYPFNYLEIGKSYRWLEEWALAEQWYDEYLARDDDASPDEIIRYSIILAKTGSIRKGEKILKKYVERYPEDWRLWSRYGYFTLWLDKIAIARNAFETALSFKPFFKEANDGLDLAKNQGYLTLAQPRAFEKEYAIDRYYKRIDKNPNDDEARFSLIAELMLKERYEEANDQLQYLSVNYEEDERYQELLEQITTFRQSQLEQQVEDLMFLLKNDPSNSDAVINLAQVYSSHEKYDDAIQILSDYLTEYGNNTEIKFNLAKNLAYNHQLDDAYPYAIEALSEDPTNMNYKLLAGQIAVWTEYDLDEAQTNLEEVLMNNPNQIDAILALSLLHLEKQEYQVTQAYINRAEAIDPANKDLENLKNMLNMELVRVENDILSEKLDVARNYAMNKDFDSAIPIYEDYMSATNPSAQVLFELAEIYMQVERYDEAIDLFDQALDYDYSLEKDKYRAKNILWSGDSLRAHDEFARLVQTDPDDLEMQAFLGDTYLSMGEYEEARKLYYHIEDINSDTLEIEERIGWLPRDPNKWYFDEFWNDITRYMFSYLIINPSGYYFGDNIDFELGYAGSGVEFGFAKHFSFGGSWHAGRMQNGVIGVNFTSLKGNMFIRPTDNSVITLTYGKLYSAGLIDEPILGLSFYLESKEKPKRDHYKITAQYVRNDASQLLYSPDLILLRLRAHLFEISGEYKSRLGLILSGSYQYIKTDTATDVVENKGNNFKFRLGREFRPTLLLGYEFFYSDFLYDIPQYYTPQKFISHSIWAEWQVHEDEEWDLKFGGKLGYIPKNNFVLSELNYSLSYRPYETLRISSQGFYGNTFREFSGYRSWSIALSAYWTLY